jgi:hypothetical protein
LGCEWTKTNLKVLHKKLLWDHILPVRLQHGLFYQYKHPRTLGLEDFLQYPTLVDFTPFIFVNASSTPQKQPAANVAI